VGLVLSQILHAANDEQFALVAYCFMPDHVHLLVEALSESSCALRFVARTKQRTGFHLRNVSSTQVVAAVWL
jgi:REP element-mobilizing transposase RayT